MRFQNEPIGTENIPQYSKYLPEEHLNKIRFGEFKATAVFLGDGKLFGVYVTDLVDGWIRFVWFALTESDVSTAEKALFIRFCIAVEKSRIEGEEKGAFVEIMKDEAWEDAREAFMLAGMEVRDVCGNNYEFTLSQVEHRDMLSSAAEKIPCIPIAEADDVLLSTLERLMQNDERPVPIPTFVDFESYDQELSCICIVKGKPIGALLVSEIGDYIVLQAAYTSGKYALPAILGYAINKAAEKYGEDKRVLAPVVVFKSEQIIEEMVGGEKREKILEAVQLF